LTRTPQEAFELLLAGNQRFVAGSPEHPNQDAARRTEVAPGQSPFAVLFGCSDSRLAAEIIFDRGLGDLFVVRTAGHVMGPEVLGSCHRPRGPRGTSGSRTWCGACAKPSAPTLRSCR
jgi:carbonic anhydrase